METINTKEFSRKSGLFIAVIGQVALLVLLLLYKLATYSSGTEVLLALAPVDPRDPLRGDYVTVRYEVNNVTTYGYSGEVVANGDTVYVPLIKQNKIWANYGGGATKYLPPSNQRSGIIYIKGVVTSGGVASASDEPNPGGQQVLSIKYGIEDYFIPEGSGRTSALASPNAYARVAIDDDGKAIVKQLYIDDKPWP